MSADPKSVEARPHAMGAAPGSTWQVTPEHVDMTRPAPAMRPLHLVAEPQSVTVDASKTALMIVDMQNDFCTEGGWLHSRGIDITPNRAPIGPLLDVLAAVRDTAMPVIWLNWGVRKDLLNIHPSLRHAHNPTGLETDLAHPVPGTRSEVIAAGSWGAQVVDELVPAKGEIHITKHRFSGFWDTETDSVLRNLGITTLLIAGVNMDQCVMTTLEDASFLGYDTILVEDCTATTSPAFCVEATLYNVKLLFGFVTASAAIIDGLSDMRAE
jgi:nicotinamidase-related amidase